MSKIIVKKGDLYGLMNVEGKIVIEPSYENMRGFVNGFAPVCKDDKWGYIDEEGNQIIDYLYEDAKDFSKFGVAPVKVNENNNSWALVKDNGQLIERENNYSYYYIGDFNPYGYAIARVYQGYCIIDKNCKRVSDEIYSSIEYLQDQEVFIVDKISNLCLINIEGEAVIDPDDDYDAIYYPNNGLCQVEKDDKCGYIDENGKLVIPLKYELGYEFADNGLAYVSYPNGLGGYINKKDEFLIPPIFQSGSYFQYGMAAVLRDGEYIFIDESGEKAINGIFKYAGGFSDCGLAKIELLDGRKGFIRPDGVIQFMIKEGWDAEEFIGDKKITQLRIGEKVGLINSQGQIVLKPSYDKIEISMDAKLHPFLENGLWGYIDDHGSVVMDNICLEASTFTEYNSAFVELYYPEEDQIIGHHINDKGLIIDDRLMRPFYMSFTDKYSQIYDFYNGIALAEKKEKTKILNSYGEGIIGEGFSLTVKDGSILID